MTTPITYHCRGSRILAPVVLVRQVLRWRKLRDEGDETALRAFVQEVEAMTGLKNGGPPLVTLSDVADRAAEVLFSRTGCGENLTASIGTVKDGQRHHTDCPKCGNRVFWESNP